MKLAFSTNVKWSTPFTSRKGNKPAHLLLKMGIQAPGESTYMENVPDHEVQSLVMMENVPDHEVQPFKGLLIAIE